ncbi:hypothetical protein [Flavobacterium sp.]|uniref:hypothetical protein n=1 Tax=Flavobacterium sp. TaxID=239 RepID=UPI00262594ED|nr:hypothetical protein [Flavobacterium sp.]
MRKITLLFAFISMITLQSCTVNENNDTVDNDTISEVYELRNINLNSINNNHYYFYDEFNPNIVASDVVLIYRMSDLINSSTPVWQQIPKTLYLDEGELDYDFDFSKQDFTIYANATYNLSLTPEYVNNETFRLVIIPGYASNRSLKMVDFSDYNAVINAFNIDDSKVTVLK